MDEQIKRISDMENALDRAQAAVTRMENAVEEYNAAADDIEKLEKYLNSEKRRKDLLTDEAGELPADLRRGVLSEDAIWNLLERNDELMSEIKKLLS